MPRKAAVEEDEGPDKSWMESYADAMTLLLAFFIMLFAFALVDETKFYDFKVGMVTALGVSDPVNEKADSLLESGNGIALTVGLSTVPSEEQRNQIKSAEDDLAEHGTVTPDNAEELRQLLDDKFAEKGASDFVTVSIDERGVVIRLDDRVLFASGSAELGTASGSLLDTTAEVLEVIDNAVDIEGHTDDVPTGRLWISNWELSAARASVVARSLIVKGPLPPRRLAAIGMADTRPIAPNDTDENRASNRRVEIVVRVSGLVESDVDIINPIDDPVGVGATPAAGEPVLEGPVLEDPVSADEETADGSQASEEAEEP